MTAPDPLRAAPTLRADDWRHARWCSHEGDYGPCDCGLFDFQQMRLHPAPVAAGEGLRELAANAAIDAHAAWYLFEWAAERPAEHAKEWLDCANPICVKRRAALASPPAPPDPAPQSAAWPSAEAALRRIVDRRTAMDGGWWISQREMRYAEEALAEQKP